MDTRRSLGLGLGAALAMMLAFPAPALALENCGTWRTECKTRCVQKVDGKCVRTENYDCKDVCTDFAVETSGPTPHIAPTMPPPKKKDQARKKAATVTPPPTPHVDNINTAPLPAPTQSCAGADGKPVKCN